MILASKGYDVEVFEKRQQVGGRNEPIRLGEYTFDTGPTFLMMKHIVDELFEITGRKSTDYMKFTEVDPMYRLKFGDGREFFPTRDPSRMESEMERLFPGSYKNYQRYMKREKIKYEHLVPCLQKPYGTLKDHINKSLIKATPYLDIHRSLFSHLGKYFHEDELRLSFTFQSKYLGMSPWICPATFSIISYIEHGLGIWHIEGGINQISAQMAKVTQEEGGKIHLNTPVKEILVRDGRAYGLKLEDGREVLGDDVVINADFGHAMTKLVDPRHRKRWTDKKIENADYSCSTFMLYLGVNKKYDIAHHNILFAHDYRLNVQEIAETFTLSEDPSIYIHNASTTDPTLAPEGKSAIYILVPIANNTSNIDWEAETPRFREKVLDLAIERGGLEDLRDHIEEELVITPTDWEQKQDVYRGATFNLGHGVNQMLYFRPHNQFEEFENCYLVGGGTHPGSGIPTILESGRLSARLILKRDFGTID